ncbi:hypothetical protein GCM10009007_07430 [Formosimonas limnophila]|uniref:Uncharacterized protein n=1 Tax=Formosimonas limnophila TaxID=1384487 RepID=A0A8J3CM84_9BURK|nr:hypothetical protein [Formosimonas limnophila]GHA69118.1 hypothetical protein GCM10009007_07430 [Formosimonas limnophila]
MYIKKIAATLMVVAVTAIAAYWLRASKEGVAALIVGLTVAAIAYRQWKTEQNKLKLDLFDRRYRIYEVTRELLKLIDLKMNSMEHLYVFWSNTSGAEFLFDSDIESYLKEVEDKALKLIEINDELADDERQNYYLTDEQRRQGRLKRRDLRSWSRDQLYKGNLAQQFKPYLAFSKLL